MRTYTKQKFTMNAKRSLRERQGPGLHLCLAARYHQRGQLPHALREIFLLRRQHIGVLSYADVEPARRAELSALYFATQRYYLLSVAG